jgi:hypothetical protein
MDSHAGILIQLCELLPLYLSGSTIAPPSLPCVNKYTVHCTVYRLIQCVSWVEGRGSGQINTCRNVPLRVFRWQHFAWPSMSLIFLRVQPTAAAPAGGATPTAGEQQPLSECLNPTVSHRKHINENNLQYSVQKVKEHRMSPEEAA